MSEAFKITLFAAFAFVAVLATGCRSRGEDVWKNVRFISEPDEATVFINGKNCGLTPRTAQLRRDSAYEVRFSKPGFFDENCSIVPAVGESGAPDIVGRIEVSLTRITADASVSRGRDMRGNVAENAESGGRADELSSPAAIAFSRRARPSDFTERLLLESELEDLVQSGQISGREHEVLRRRLFSAAEQGEDTLGVPDEKKREKLP